MIKIKASDLFIKCLEEEGVEYVFAVPGEENLDFVESIRKSKKIKLIVNRHEQCAAFMAATYGRLTGKVGVCMSTLGPGATNLVTGIAYAQLGGMPLLAITGQKGIRENWQADFQVIDVVKMMEPITKKTMHVHGPKEIPFEVRALFKTATTERQGAVHIEIAEDIAEEDVEEKFAPQKPSVIRRPIGERKAIANAGELIKNAKNPIIIVSSRAQRNLVREEMRALCDETNLYVIHTQLGKGVLGDDHKNSLYAFGIHKRDYVNCVVDKADVILTIGYDKSEHPPYVWNQNMNKKIIHLDFDPARGDTYYNPDIEIVGDIAGSLKRLRKELAEYTYSGDYPGRIKEELDEKLFTEGSTDDTFPMLPRRIVADCRKALGHDDIICMDNGIYKMWFSRHYKTFNIGTFLIDNTLATMGAGFPSAMAAALVNPDKKVLAVCGDGGFMMNSQEIETAVRLGLNVVCLIVNDNAYGFIKWKQQNYGFEDFGLDYTNPDFVKYAESYGAKGYRVGSASELLPTLEKAFANKGVAIVECPIDYKENKTVWNEELDNLSCKI